MKPLQKRTQEIQRFLVQTRRHLHQNPESSLHEYDTCAYIQKELKQYGIPYETVGATGTLAIIEGNKGIGKTVLLRADIDALEVIDLTGAEYASKRPGLNHACGHDAHTAMGLGTAKILWDLRSEFSGTVKIAFQPAEEIGAGAKQFVASGLIGDIDESFAIHVNSGLPVGTLAVRAGAVNASCDIFKIKVTGESSHVGKPHWGKDALVTASEIVVALQTIVAREISPHESAVVGIGKLNAGTRYNIVASNAEIEGTIRAFSHETRSQLKEAVTRIAQGVGATHRCEVAIDWYDAAAPVINSADLAEIATVVGHQLDAIDTVVTDYSESMGADDFADYLVEKPGVYALLGSQGDAKTAFGHHHEQFDIDERVLEFGVQYEVAYLLARLGS